MSKHWNPRLIDGGRAAALPRPARKRPWPGFGELRLMLFGGVFAGLVLALWPAAPDAATGPAASPALVRVIDGDTFDYAGERIRIADIDTPEVNARCGREAELAARATARTRAWLAAGPFELRPLADRDYDRYGRKLRVVTRDGRSIGDVLVAEGLARRWQGYRRPWCA